MSPTWNASAGASAVTWVALENGLNSVYDCVLSVPHDEHVAARDHAAVEIGGQHRVPVRLGARVRGIGGGRREGLRR